jgi:S1-C subfamily serine protease
MKGQTRVSIKASLRGFRPAIVFLALILPLLLSLAGCSASAGSLAATAPASATPAPLGSSANAVPAESDFSTAVLDVAKAVKPAVVQITNEQVKFDSFTNQPFTVPAGVGTGVIYDDQNHILTNNHVIASAQQLTVALPNSESVYTATLVGADPYTDLAVLKIEGQRLPVARLGDSHQLQVGQWVVAIGNALGLPGGPTVTAGVVSALGRTVQEPGENGGPGPFLFDVIQTDAAINPGNSGGPLIDLQGDVIGINTIVATQAEPGVPAQGIGFAISIASAKEIAGQLVADGHASHPYLGVQTVALNPMIASRIGTTAKIGVVVVGVGSDTPAAAAGLQPRDIITEIDGVAVTDDASFAKIINTHKPGEAIDLTVVRGKETLHLKPTLVERPAPAP